MHPRAGLGLKAVWVGAEALGNLIGAKKALGGQGGGASAAPGSSTLSRQEAIAAIKEDYSQNYFVSGKPGAECWLA